MDRVDRVRLEHALRSLCPLGPDDEELLEFLLDETEGLQMPEEVPSTLDECEASPIAPLLQTRLPELFGVECDRLLLSQLIDAYYRPPSNPEPDEPDPLRSRRSRECELCERAYSLPDRRR